MRSDPRSVTNIEGTLDAICRTPTKHRSELRLQVKLPVLSQVSYQPLTPEASLGSYTRTIDSLGRVFRDLKISEDPYVLSLLADNTDRSRRKLEKVWMNHKTWCHDQMKNFHATTLKICSELGAWAADYYAFQVIDKVTKAIEGSSTFGGIWDVTSAEKQYIAQALEQVEVSGHTACETPASIPLVTDKVSKLLQLLVQKSKSVTFSGIVFVQERALAAVLTHLLSVHPDTRDIFRIGTIVGTSNHTHRAKNIGDLIGVETQKNALSLFKTGRINLVIATSVLEEGIDVPSCNIVVCFQKPANLKSFVQRRGRARHRDSELILMLESTDKGTEWHQLEAAMRKIYEDEMRILEELLLREDTEESGNRTFQVPETGALLEFDNAVSHLYHFCATLPAKEYVDLRPDFVTDIGSDGLVRATVTLPTLVDEEVRIASGEFRWITEKNAIKDAAFVAYKALYNAGLVNNNLLPLLRHDPDTDELTSSDVEKRASTVSVSEQLNPWLEVARKWEMSRDNIYQATVTIGEVEMTTWLPIAIPQVSPFETYWDTETTLQVTISVAPGSIIASPEIMSKAWHDTWVLLQSAFGSRFSVQEKQVVMPFFSGVDVSQMLQLGRQPVRDRIQLNHRTGLIREKSDPHVAYLFREFLSSKPSLNMVQNPYKCFEETPDGPHLSLKRLPRRTDFLHKTVPGNGPLSSKKYSVVLPMDRCTVDGFPFQFVQVGLLIPSIMHRFGIYLLAKALSESILKDVGISDLSLVSTAMSASSANEATNYQRLEFLGDSILKTCSSVELMAIFPLWHQGYLSAKKDRLVSNSRLSRAAIESGLDAYIITKPFSGYKWRPMYVLLSIGWFPIFHVSCGTHAQILPLKVRYEDLHI